MTTELRLRDKAMRDRSLPFRPASCNPLATLSAVMAVEAGTIGTILTWVN